MNVVGARRFPVSGQSLALIIPLVTLLAVSISGICASSGRLKWNIGLRSGRKPRAQRKKQSERLHG